MRWLELFWPRGERRVAPPVRGRVLLFDCADAADVPDRARIRARIDPAGSMCRFEMADAPERFGGAGCEAGGTPGGWARLRLRKCDE
jgi:hypothetical protein